MTQDELFRITARFISNVHGFETRYARDRSAGDVTDLQFSLLQVLYFTGSYCMSDLSRCLNTNLPNTSREVKKLVLLDYVARQPSPIDRRQTNLSLTAKGKELIEGTMDDMKKQFFKTSGEWTEKRIKECINSIEILEKEIFG